MKSVCTGNNARRQIEANLMKMCTSVGLCRIDTNSELVSGISAEDPVLHALATTCVLRNWYQSYLHNPTEVHIFQNRPPYLSSHLPLCI
eukprot:scaffold3353_cov144-Skeletonema_menzelii.AAC.24